MEEDSLSIVTVSSDPPSKESTPQRDLSKPRLRRSSKENTPPPSKAPKPAARVSKVSGSVLSWSLINSYNRVNIEL